MELEKAKAIAEELKRLLELGSIQKRFWSKVVKSSDPAGCWIWTGAKNPDGYGKLEVGSYTIGAHRIAYEIQVGPIPLGASVLHSCDTCACVRGAHLFIGNQADNMADMIRKGRGNKACGDSNGSRLYPERHRWGATHSLRLHPELLARGERAGNAKLTSAQVQDIRGQWRQGLSQHALARKFQVSLSSIQRIVLGETWQHLYEG